MTHHVDILVLQYLISVKRSSVRILFTGKCYDKLTNYNYNLGNTWTVAGYCSEHTCEKGEDGKPHIRING